MTVGRTEAAPRRSPDRCRGNLSEALTTPPNHAATNDTPMWRTAASQGFPVGPQSVIDQRRHFGRLRQTFNANADTGPSSGHSLALAGRYNRRRLNITTRHRPFPRNLNSQILPIFGRLSCAFPWFRGHAHEGIVGIVDANATYPLRALAPSTTNQRWRSPTMYGDLAWAASEDADEHGQRCVFGR